jgi:hypothetical protein
MPVIVVTQGEEIKRVTVQSLWGQIVYKNLYWKNPSQKRGGGVAQGVGSEFKLHSTKKEKKLNTVTSTSLKYSTSIIKSFKIMLWAMIHKEENNKTVFRWGQH